MGGVQISLTTEGDFTGESGLAIDRFPTANDEGNISYERTFEIDEAMAQSLTGQQFAVVQHGIDIDGSGSYDGDAESSLDPSLPLEATIPAVCGVMSVQAAVDDTAAEEDDAAAEEDATPAGGADTGAGGAADSGAWDPALVAALLGAVAIGAGGYVAMRRTNHES